MKANIYVSLTWSVTFVLTLFFQGTLLAVEPDEINHFEVSPVFSEIEDCVAIVRRNPMGCLRKDCEAYLYGRYNLCESRDCKAMVLGELGLCQTRDCKALVLGNQSFCGSPNCRGVMFRIERYCQ